MIEQVIITNLTRPHAAAHMSYIHYISDSISCHTLSRLQEKEKCSYIIYTKPCHEMDVNIDYSKFLYCSCNKSEYREVCILILILLCIFYILIIVVVSYSCLSPNIVAIIKHMKLSQYGGSMFAIAFSCSLTGVLEVRKRYKNDTELIISEMFTTNLYLRCFFAGLFLLYRPIILHPFYYTRDQIFYITGLLVTFSFMRPNNFNLVSAIIGISLYIIILTAVGVQENIKNLAPFKNDINALHHLQQKLYVVIHPDEQSKLKINKQQSIFKQFLDSLGARRLELAYRSNYWQKLILIMGLPINTFIALCIPVYHPLLPMNGWSKLLNLLNLFIFPAIFGFVLYENIPIIVTGVYFVLATLFAVYLIYRSTANKPPKLHIVFAYIGNIFCVGFIFVCESELKAVLTVLGYTFGLYRAAIGTHLLSISRTFATSILSATFASWGYNVMAYRILVFTPMVLTNLAIAVLVLLKCIEERNGYAIIRPGINGYSGVVYSFIEFFSTFAAVLLLNFHLRKSLGYYTLIMFCMFMLMRILSGTYFIHTFGTGHLPDESSNTDVKWA